MGRKVYEVVGYAVEGAAYCVDHKPDDATEDDVIFLQDADDLMCDVPGCGYLDGRDMDSSTVHSLHDCYAYGCFGDEW